MYDILNGMRVVEGSSFVASPTCGLYLAQMGAEVIRFDMIGGGPDHKRWPRASGDGASFYWEGLNKGKKSVAIDLGRAEGRELAVAIVSAPGDRGGMFITNFPVDGFLRHDRLAQRRPDLITVRIMGNADGSPALDYTVNSAIGMPFMTGPEALGDRPVNHVLPAWDLLAGAYGAFAMLAGERHRRLTGQGQEIRVPLADIAITTVANLGQIAEVLSSGVDRPRYGNDVFGAFGRDFLTGDGRRLMIIALTSRQWTGLIAALGIGEGIDAIERDTGVSLASDEGLRFVHRDRISALVQHAVGRRTSAELEKVFDAQNVCWGPYQTLLTATADPRLVSDNPVFDTIDHPSGIRYPAPGAAATLPHALRSAPVRAPRLGEHTDWVLAEVLGLGSAEIGRLHDTGIVASDRAD